MPTMPLVCPGCGSLLEYSRLVPRFCSSCGRPLSAGAGAARTTPHDPAVTPDSPTVPGGLPPGAQPTLAYAAPGPEGLPHPETVGGYRLVRPLGSGGMGTVYQAEEAATGRRVAVKLIRPEFADSPDTVERFRREGRLASTVLHPRCVFVLGADEEAGRPYIVMELMPGQTLGDLVDHDGPLPVADAVRRVLDVIDGLQEAHRLGVIHRDVKPSNCFLDADGRVKVGDFGLAKSLLGPEHLTRSGSFLGTVLFASPEQIRNEAVGPQTDVYSVCATLFYLLTGRAPFQEDDPAAALARAVSDPPPSMRLFRKGVPATLDEVVRRGLARSRRQRWQSLEELRLALLPFVDCPSCTPEVGWRVSAYLADLLALVPLELGVQKLVVALAPASRWWLGPLFLSVPISFFCGLLYFALPEWLIGGSPGKLLMRLRVRDAATGDRPSAARSALRTLTFYLVKDAPQLLAALALVYLAPRLFEEGDVGIATRVLASVVIVALLPFLSGGAGAALLAVTMRRPNGYRGVHELLSGTRVIRLPGLRPRFRLPAASAWPAPTAGAALPAGIPGRVGAFSVSGLARGAENEVLLFGQDAALHRPVWLWLRRGGAGPLPASRRESARDGRPRWLAGGEQDGWRWDAFVAAPGCLLADLVSGAKPRRHPLGWADTLSLLEQLAAELERAEQDGSLPERLSPEQVWVQAGGRALLLDAPPRPPTPAATPLDLLRQAAALALEGRVRPAGELTLPVRAPVPTHAAELLDRLMGAAEPFTGLAELREALAQAHEKPEEISRPMRGLQVALTLVGLGPGLLFLFAAGPCLMLGAYLICVLGAAQGEFRRERAEQDAELRRLDEEMDRLDDDREAVLASWSGFLRNRLQQFEDRYRRQFIGRLRAYAEDEDELEGLDDLAGSDDLLAGPSGLAEELLLHGWWLAGAFAAWPLLWAAWAALARGGLAPRLAGVALVGADGRPAARWRCAWRALLVWAPVALLLLAAAWLDVWRVASARDGWSADEVRLAGWLSWHLWWAAVVFLCAYVFTAITWPNRALHDRLAGVYPVPR
jgi:eukaryotic-like serine/threonine-protein kinase